MINIHSQNYDDQDKIAREIRIFIENARRVLNYNGVRKQEHQLAIANSLIALYNAEDRFYHTCVHINRMYEDMGKHFGELAPSEQLAILFHDIIYVPGQIDNEGRSVDLMVMLMAGFGIPLTEWCWASRIIKETANHLQFVHDPSTYAVLDLDLTPLATPFEDFMEQNHLLALELPEVTVQQRVAFLRNFLAKDKIFYRLTSLEQAARQNIIQYIELIETQDVNA